jgi:hypothetical protein
MPDALSGRHDRVGWGFIALYALSYSGGSLVLIAPLLVTLALKVNDLVGIDDAPKNLALISGIGSLLAMVSNPLFGRLSDRTTARLGMRRPWMLVGLHRPLHRRRRLCAPRRRYPARQRRALSRTGSAAAEAQVGRYGPAMGWVLGTRRAWSSEVPCRSRPTTR